MKYYLKFFLSIFLLSCNNRDFHGIEIKCLDRKNEEIFVIKDEEILGVDWNNQSFLISSKKSDLIKSTSCSLYGLYFNSKLLYYVNIANPYDSNKRPKNNAPYVVFSEIEGVLVEKWFIIQPYSYKSDSNLEKLVFDKELFTYVKENKLNFKNWEMTKDSISNIINLSFIEDFHNKFPNQKMAYKFRPRIPLCPPPLVLVLALAVTRMPYKQGSSDIKSYFARLYVRFML